MIDTQFTVCTYNIGRIEDYLKLCKYRDSSYTIKSKEEDESFQKKYDRIQSETTKLLEDQADVFCFQEVGKRTRPIIQTLQSKGFKIVHDEKYDEFDTAVALNTSRFKNITPHSFNIQLTDSFNKDVAIATAEDIQTHQSAVFVSAHAPGFNLSQATINRDEAADGDLYCKTIAHELSEMGTYAIQVIGADMNANPEKWNPRFQFFSHQGFQIIRTGSSTNVNPKDSTYQEREIDFIFAKTTQSIGQKIKSIFSTTIKNHVAVKPFDPLGWDIEKNASDHLAIFMNVSSYASI